MTHTEAAVKPWYTEALLAASVLAVSSAGAVLKSMTGVGPVTRAAWRNQVTALLLSPGASWQLWQAPPDLREQLREPSCILRLSAAGALLALHFGLWVWSLEATSLPHSLLLVSMPPLLLAVWGWAFGQRLTWRARVAVAASVAGAVLLSFGAASEKSVTLAGDGAALGGAAAFAVYLTLGKQLRATVPLFIYAAPVTAVASLGLTAAAMVLETEPLRAIFGWVSTDTWKPILYLALGPGLLGHTGFNAVLRHVEPLTIALACAAEPLLGSLIGWAAGLATVPSIWTWAGGALLVAAAVTTSLPERATPTECSQELQERHNPQGLGSGDDRGCIVASKEADMEVEPFLA